MAHPRFHAETNPDKPAIIMAGSGQMLTYGDLEARANQGAHYLRSWRIARPGCWSPAARVPRSRRCLAAIAANARTWPRY